MGDLQTDQGESLELFYVPASAFRRIVEGLARLGVRVRDRSPEHGCAGCIRITAGIVDETRRAAAALEEVLCAAP